MRKSLLFFLILCCLNIGLTQAQTRRIEGIVTEAANGQPVIGASILVVGTNKGTITNIDGKFILDGVPSSAKKIKVSYIGLKTTEVKIKPVLKIALEADSEMLEEVVVTGMQKMDKRLFTGATTKISAEDAKLDGVPDVSRALEGRAAGVSVQNVSGTFGTAPKIRVRGATSIMGSSKPLWVVDGVVMEDVAEVSSDDLSSGDAVTLISSAIAGLNADDIESFQILKDGSATSIYGARAMAGVIVITTKKGKVGTNKIRYTGEFTYRLKPSYDNFNIMDSQEQMDVYQELMNAGYLNYAETFRAKDSGVYGKMYQLLNVYDPKTGFGLENTEAAKLGYLRGAETRNTDWFNELFKENVMSNHSISVSSGTEKASYYASMSYMNDPGWTYQSKVERYTANLNVLYNITKKVKLNMISNGAYRKQKAPGTLSQSTNVVSGEVSRDFDINPYSYATHSSRTLDANTFYTSNYAPFNIKHELDNNYMDLSVADLKFQARLSYKPINKVEIALLGAYKYSSANTAHSITELSNQAMAYRAMGDATIMESNKWLYSNPDDPNSLPVSVLEKGGFYKEQKRTMDSKDLRATVSYNDVFNENHILNVFAGMEANSITRKMTSYDAVGMQYEMGMLTSWDYLYFKRLQEQNSDYNSFYETYSRSIGYFINSTYSYQGKYTINGNMRYEGSNKLGKSRSARWLPVWNVSGAWNAHEEKWFDQFEDVVSNLTLKTSYSLTADRGPASVSNSAVMVQGYNPYRGFTALQESGLYIVAPANEDLTYEKKHEFNLGAEIGFLDNRINLAVDWYKRNNYDLIGATRTPGTTGNIMRYANMASMESDGLEISLSTRNIATKDFKWTTNFIFSKANNKITDLDTNAMAIDMVAGSGFAREGYPVRSIFSFDFQGLNDEGLPTFINEDGELTVDDINFQETEKLDHLKYSGAADPDVTGSLGNMFTYKNFKLNVFMTYSFGNVVRLNPVFSNKYTDLDAMPREFKNRWIMPGDEKKTNVPVIASQSLNQKYSSLQYAYNAYNYSTARIAKGDFVRLKEISLAYTCPKDWIKPLHVNDLSVKLQATNLWLMYSDDKLNGQDPEFANNGGVAVPVPKQFTFTLKVGL